MDDGCRILGGGGCGGDGNGSRWAIRCLVVNNEGSVVDGTDYGLSTLRSFFCQYQKFKGKKRMDIMRHTIIWTSPTHPTFRLWGLTGLDMMFLPSDGIRPAPPPALFGAAFLGFGGRARL